MQDGYSFHASKEDLASFYEKMGRAYENIFRNCGLLTVGVEADSGAIGGASSKEFMVIADTGEDSILFTESGSYAANIEKAVSITSEPIQLKKSLSEWIETPNQKTIDALCKNNDLDPSQIIKIVIFIAKFEDKTEIPILSCIRGDQNINETKLFNLVNEKYNSNLLNLFKLEDKKVIDRNLNNFPLGFIGPDMRSEEHTSELQSHS